MTPRLRSVRGAAHALTAGAVSAVVLGALALGAGPLPALGRALDPGHGVWASAAGGILPRSQALSIAGLEHPVSVRLTAQGVPSIRAADDSDVYLAQGYVEASFRLTEMDLDRRLGEGALAQLAGRPGVASDEFELRLGLLRTAEEEWARTPRSSPSGQELLAYARGVNDYIAHERATKAWPALFSLTGVFPQEWTPVDSLVVQEVLTQELDFTATPLDYALLERSLGAAKTMAWFPVEAANPQSPYDPGPYSDLGLKPIGADAASTVGGVSSAGAGSTGNGEPASSAITAPGKVTSGLAEAVTSVLASVSGLPAGQVHQYPDSNAWAANGPEVSGGGAMLAGDPHLPQTLPSVWYQIALGSPDLAVSGVSLPGVPGIVIGRNAHIAWSLTDVQNQSTLFYAEETSRSHPDQYYWRGRWRPMRQAHYTIKVRVAAAVQLTVDITVHGPIMTEAGQTLAVDWMGNVPSPDIAVIGEISKASNFAQFRAALAAWVAPTQNFVYADDAGNIGAIAAGYYPQVAHGDPWLPLSGTGADDVAGVIPYAAVPQVYDPAGHTVASANQRPVGSSYPYYIGTSADIFDPGYRSAEINTYLRGHSGMGMADFAALQASDTDSLAGTITPRLLAALRGDPALDATGRAALRQLSQWNDTMTARSTAATIWFTFWRDYVSAVFQPWWKAAKVPVTKDPPGLTANWQQFSLVEDLQAWTVADPGNPAFTPPGAAPRTATQVMRSAFAVAVAQLSAKLGRAPDTWMWGRVHSAQFPSITGARALGYGPVPAGGDDWTVSAADGYPVSSQGPSWRMIVEFTDRGQSRAEGIYPGGQSENSASPWYSDLIAYWRKGTYLALPPAGGYSAGPITWSLRPGGES
jgi:penicillin G amidase